VRVWCMGEEGDGCGWVRRWGVCRAHCMNQGSLHTSGQKQMQPAPALHQCMATGLRMGFLGPAGLPYQGAAPITIFKARSNNIQSTVKQYSKHGQTIFKARSNKHQTRCRATSTTRLIFGWQGSIAKAARQCVSSSMPCSHALAAAPGIQPQRLPELPAPLKAVGPQLELIQLSCCGNAGRHSSAPSRHSSAPSGHSSGPRLLHRLQCKRRGTRHAACRPRRRPRRLAAVLPSFPHFRQWDLPDPLPAASAPRRRRRKRGGGEGVGPEVRLDVLLLPPLLLLIL
jgi:hypothetical protein